MRDLYYELSNIERECAELVKNGGNEVTFWADKMSWATDEIRRSDALHLSECIDWLFMVCQKHNAASRNIAVASVKHDAETDGIARLRNALVVAFVQGMQWWELNRTEAIAWPEGVSLLDAKACKAEEEAKSRLENGTLGVISRETEE